MAKSNRYRHLLAAILIFIGAIALTWVSSNYLQGKEKPVRELCLIEDCAFSAKRVGFPFKTGELVRYEGLNCDPDIVATEAYTSDCERYENIAAEMWLLNYLFFAGILSLVYFIINKIRAKSK